MSFRSIAIKWLEFISRNNVGVKYSDSEKFIKYNMSEIFGLLTVVA